MEPTRLILNHIPCPLEKHDIIRKVDIDSNNELSLACIECRDITAIYQPIQERFILEDFLKQIAKNYEQIPKLQELPASAKEILDKENDFVASFTQHIEKEKEKVNNVIDKIRQAVYQKLESKRRKLIADLEAQIKEFEAALSFYKQKVLNFKESQEPNPTFESLYQDISKMANAEELKRFLQIHHENTKDSEVFEKVEEDLAKTYAANAIKWMDFDLRKTYTGKPTLSFGVNNRSLEDALKQWEDQTVSAINGLMLDVKDRVMPLKFQLFESAIVNFEDQKMMKNWVFETTKAEPKFKLLYRGSRDGFSGTSFHSKCDNKGPTVVVIRSNFGKVFGGFTDVIWKTENTYRTTKNAFLFSIDKKAKYHIKSGCEKNAIRCHGGGPSFGEGDIRIFDTNVQSLLGDSSSNFPCTYNCNEYPYPGDGKSNFLAGANKFTVSEIEVYSV